MQWCDREVGQAPQHAVFHPSVWVSRSAEKYHSFNEMPTFGRVPRYVSVAEGRSRVEVDGGNAGGGAGGRATTCGPSGVVRLLARMAGTVRHIAFIYNPALLTGSRSTTARRRSGCGVRRALAGRLRSRGRHPCRLSRRRGLCRSHPLARRSTSARTGQREQNRPELRNLVEWLCLLQRCHYRIGIRF